MSFATSSLNKEAKSMRTPRYSPQNQQILDDTMIPGPALRFFKTKREKKRHENGKLVKQKEHSLVFFGESILIHFC